MGVCISKVDEKEKEYEKEEKQQNEEKVQQENGHIKKMTNHYTTHYPSHEPRKNSTIYTKTHHELCHVRDLPCFICRKTNKKDGCITETHHFYVEKAGENAIDWHTFGEHAKICYNIQTGENIGDTFDWNEVAKNPDIFVDSKYNMIVLCKEHHTSGNKGIHHVPFPDWILQKYAKKDFEFLI
jgi:DNA gyrase/topoisomerase IV subunit A